jgi:multiple sugar transport system permease protein
MTTKNNEKLTFKETLALLKTEAKENYQEFKVNIKNPIKRAVYGQKISGVATNILRGFIIFGLAFIILYPIFQEVIVAIKDPIDLNNPLVIWIP